jgi:hypothetical protein
MSTDFHKVLVKDGRIANLTSDIGYAVNKGGQQVTSASFNTISPGSTSSQVFNIQVPSQETIVDRHVLWTATITLKVTGNWTGAGDEGQIINYGINDVISAFPLHQLCTTMSSTINNNTVSLNVRDVLPTMLRMIDDRELAQYNNTTPVQYDKYASYNSGNPFGGGGSNVKGPEPNTPNSPFAGYEQISDNCLHPRATFALEAVGKDYNNGVISAPLAALANGTATPSVTGYVRIRVSEPLLLSPFLFGNPENNAGMYGLQNLNFQFNLGDCSRVWRTTGLAADNFTGYAVTLQDITDSSLNFMFITPHPSDLLASRCVVPFYELPRYISQGTTNIAAGAQPAYVGGPLLPATQTLQFSSISLNQIPDKLVIFARIPLSSQTYSNTDSYFPITGIQLNWNNNSGICSSYTQQDLFACSKRAGSNQSWDEFRGYAYTSNGGVLTTAGNGAGAYVLTTGSALMLDMGRDVNIVEDYYAPGSIGNFVLNFNLSIQNFTPYTGAVELVVMTMISGVFVTERGTSSTYTALLSKQDVLEASEQEAVPHSSVKRLVGSGFLDSLKSVFGKLFKAGQAVAPYAKQGLKLYSGISGAKYGDNAGKAADVLGQLGYGMSAGGRSGGGGSGGSLKSRIR